MRRRASAVTTLDSSVLQGAAESCIIFGRSIVVSRGMRLRPSVSLGCVATLAAFFAPAAAAGPDDGERPRRIPDGRPASQGRSGTRRAASGSSPRGRRRSGTCSSADSEAFLVLLAFLVAYRHRKSAPIRFFLDGILLPTAVAAILQLTWSPSTPTMNTPEATAALQESLQ